MTKSYCRDVEKNLRMMTDSRSAGHAHTVLALGTVAQDTPIVPAPAKLEAMDGLPSRCGMSASRFRTGSIWNRAPPGFARRVASVCAGCDHDHLLVPRMKTTREDMALHVGVVVRICPKPFSGEQSNFRDKRVHEENWRARRPWRVPKQLDSYLEFPCRQE